MLLQNKLQLPMFFRFKLLSIFAEPKQLYPHETKKKKDC